MNSTNTPFKYFAFISYCHKDERYAKWLQRKIESYNLPTQIKQENPNLKKGIRPVFRDKTDLGAGVLLNNIKEELASSKVLIVVCSPESAKSEWVGIEINEFLKTHKPEVVIPFIVNGVPNSDNENECFNAAIKEIKPELLGIDVRDLGRKQALTKVVAKILNLRFDVLWQRHLRRERQKRKFISAVTAVCLCVGAVVYYSFFHISTKYYVDYVNHNGIPEGINEKRKKDIKSDNFKFEYKAGKLHRVSLCTKYGYPSEGMNTEWIERVPIQEYKYKNDREFVVTNRDAYGAFLCDWEVHLHDGYYIINILKGGEGVSTSSNALSNMIKRKHYTDFSEEETTSRAPIRSYKVIMDKEGYDVMKLFGKVYGYSDEPAMDLNGVEGFRYIRNDSLHRITCLEYIDHNGKPVSDRLGVSKRNYEYDVYGNLCRASYCRATGEYVLNEYHWAIAKDTYDEYGQPVSQEYFGPDGNRILALNGAAIFRFEMSGDTEVMSAFDANENPTMTCLSPQNDLIFHRCVTQTNKRGTRTVVRKYDAEGNPSVFDGFFQEIREYTNNRRVLSFSYYDIDGHPTYNGAGFHRRVMKFDGFGNVAITENYDADGKLTMGVSNLPAVIKRKFDENNNVTEELFFNQFGQPTAHAMYGGAMGIYEHYEGGKRDSVAFLSMDGKSPMNTQYGFATVSTTYDKWGRIIKQVAWNQDGSPAMTSNNYGNTYHGMLKEYDSDGHLNVLVEIDEYDDTLRTKRFIWKDGRMIEERFCDAKGNAENLPVGYAIIRYGYTDGVQTSMSYFDADGLPVKSPMLGAHEVRTNSNGVVATEQTSWNESGQPCLNEIENAFKLVITNNNFGECEGNVRYGLKGERVNNIAGVCEERCVYNPNGQVAHYSAWDKDGGKANNMMGIHEILYEYDGRNAQIRQEYKDKDGNYVVGPEGAASAYVLYDKFHNSYARIFKDENGMVSESVMNNYPVQLVIYNETGESAEAVYDAFGSLVAMAVIGFRGMHMGAYFNDTLFIDNQPINWDDDVLEELRGQFKDFKCKYEQYAGVSLDWDALGVDFHE